MTTLAPDELIHDGLTYGDDEPIHAVPYIAGTNTPMGVDGHVFTLCGIPVEDLKKHPIPEEEVPDEAMCLLCLDVIKKMGIPRV